MDTTALTVAFILFLAPTGTAKAPAIRKSVAPLTVGQVFIVGNVRTRDELILRELQVYPGQALNYADLGRAQDRLAGLGVFRPGGVRVTAEDDPNNPGSEYKNIFVRVEETGTGRWRLVPTPGCPAGPAVSVVWEERNFDPTRVPTGWDDLLGGSAFRGAGQTVRLEVLQMSFTGVVFPRFLPVGGVCVP